MTKNDNCNVGVPQEPTLSEILASLEDQQVDLIDTITEIGWRLFSIDSPKMSGPDGSVSQRLVRLLQENIGLLELSNEILRKL